MWIDWYVCVPLLWSTAHHFIFVCEIHIYKYNFFFNSLSFFLTHLIVAFDWEPMWSSFQSTQKGIHHHHVIIHSLQQFCKLNVRECVVRMRVCVHMECVYFMYGCRYLFWFLYHTQMFIFQMKHDRHFVYMWLMQSSVAFQEAKDTPTDCNYTICTSILECGSIMPDACMQNTKSMSNISDDCELALCLIHSLSMLLRHSVCDKKMFNSTEKWLDGIIIHTIQNSYSFYLCPEKYSLFGD